ncbi:hypothetical protein [Pseudomonas sp.]|uniref:hypothetical protein n=1 Tax=Pseudomonas sp. TaxID=306 RepID=UPI0028AAD5ED|nr:hypothetical protein [Pseudomonas sp.]
MKKTLVLLSFMLCASAQAAQLLKDYPSCTTSAQEANHLKATGPTEDPLHNHILARVEALSDDLRSAKRTRTVSASDASALIDRIEAVRASADRDVKGQGFLSAGERASYDRELNAVALAFCNPH